MRTRNLTRILGVGLVVVSLAGGVLAIGSLFSAGPVAGDLTQAQRKQWAATLRESGVTEPVLQRFRDGEALDRAAVSRLTRRQRRDLAVAEQSLAAVARAAKKAAAGSRKKSGAGIAFAVLGMVAGIVLLAVRRPSPDAACRFKDE